LKKDKSRWSDGSDREGAKPPRNSEGWFPAFRDRREKGRGSKMIAKRGQKENGVHGWFNRVSHDG